MSQILFHKKLPFGDFTVYDEKPDFALHKVKQCHGNAVVPASASEIEADGLYTSESSHFTPLAIVTADCLPIAIAGKKGLAMVHAGWRGVKEKIYLTPSILNLEPYYFFIGPHISAESFEVSPDFRENFPQSKHFKMVNNKLFFNLEAQVKEDISLALPHAQVESSGVCTVKDHSFHSYRRDATSKRNWNILTSPL